MVVNTVDDSEENETITVRAHLEYVQDSEKHFAISPPQISKD
jgi:hypothetical protein